MSADRRVGVAEATDSLVEVAYDWDLTVPQARAMIDLLADAIDGVASSDATAGLDDPAVVAAYVHILDHHLGTSAAQICEAQAGRALADGVNAAGVHFLLARAAELRGDIDRWRRRLDRTLRADETFTPAVFELGFVAFVEGDVATARRRLTDGHDLRAGSMLDALGRLPSPRSSLGRNDQCPCDSGKKVKRCCGMEAASRPLEARAPWLWEKVAWCLRRPPLRPAYIELVDELVEEPFDDPLDELFDEPAADRVRGRKLRVLSDDATEAIALLDGQLLGDVLSTFGRLLPPDERRLAQLWRGQRHRLWSVEVTHPGRSLSLVDVHTGDRVEALHADVSRCTTPGEFVFGAVVPTGAGWMMPRHHIGIAPARVPDVATWIDECHDPIEVAQRVFDALCSEADERSC